MNSAVGWSLGLKGIIGREDARSVGTGGSGGAESWRARVGRGGGDRSWGGWGDDGDAERLRRSSRGQGNCRGFFRPDGGKTWKFIFL